MKIFDHLLETIILLFIMQQSIVQCAKVIKIEQFSLFLKQSFTFFYHFIIKIKIEHIKEGKR